MFDQQKVSTPEELAKVLQILKNSVYDLIGRGEIMAKEIGLDYDHYLDDLRDRKNLKKITDTLTSVRTGQDEV